MLKSLAYSLAIAALALALGAFCVAQAPPDPLVAVRAYHVTTAAVFPSLPLPARSLLFRNGLFQSPGIDYDVVFGPGFRFRPGVLSDGDSVTVVSIAP
jgi:hypothetical protein